MHYCMLFLLLLSCNRWTTAFGTSRKKNEVNDRGYPIPRRP